MEAMTADALRAEIEATKERQRAAQRRGQELIAEIRQADERQRLRQELEQARRELADEEEANQGRADLRQNIDADICGMCIPLRKPGWHHARSGDRTSCGHAVSRGEFVWEIEHLSWLSSTLWQRSRKCTMSNNFRVGSYDFCCLYSPEGGLLNQLPRDAQHGTLAICTDDCKEFLFRYSIFIKAAGGDFVQWGETWDELNVVQFRMVFGPDVHWERYPPAEIGIFGLTHRQLLQSEWVESDTLTVKFVIEVRPDEDEVTQPLREAVEIPGPNMQYDTEALLQNGTCCDVQFVFQDEVIPAHSPILCARSEVFQKQLSAGLQESVSKEIVVEDCDAATFKAFLKFLYTDCLPTAEELRPKSSDSSENREDGQVQFSPMLAMLAVSHKYEVTRLQRWCEQQLREHLSTSEVCSILVKAHLFQAEHLEKACLTHIKNHVAEVVKLPAYLELMMAWPQIMLKVTLFMTGTPETSEAAAVDAGQSTQTANTEVTHMESTRLQ